MTGQVTRWGVRGVERSGLLSSERGQRASARGEGCDTRPFRRRVPTSYAGCMTVAPTPAIDCVYGSALSYRQGLWVRRGNFVFVGPLAPLVSGSRPWPGKHPIPRRPRWPDWAFGSLVTADQGGQDSCSVGHLGRLCPLPNPSGPRASTLTHSGAGGILSPCMSAGERGPARAYTTKTCGGEARWLRRHWSQRK